MDQAHEDAELMTDEGTGPMKAGRFVVYDDATGQPIVPGTLVKGHPTIGYGIALDVRGISAAEALFLLHDGEQDFSNQLIAALPWTAALDDVRFAALLSMAYNLGIAGLLGFTTTLKYAQANDWPNAVASMKQSKWWGQVGSRATRIAAMLLTGQWQVQPKG
jgi:lysozyme